MAFDHAPGNVIGCGASLRQRGMHAHAARMKPASRRNGKRIGIGGAELRVRHAAPRLRRQHRLQQRLAVGMPRRAEQRVRLGLLDDPPEIHDGHPRRHVLDDGEVVADQQVGQPHVAAQVLQQVQDLRLHRHVERRGRLVADHQARLVDQRPRDGNALALAARQLARIVVVEPPRQADALHHLLDPRPPLRRLRVALGAQRQRDDRADRLARIERRIGVLEHRLHQRRDLAARLRRARLAADADLARGRRQQAEQHARQRGLAAARTRRPAPPPRPAGSTGRRRRPHAACACP